MTDPTPAPPTADPFEIPEGIRRAKAALRRDLTELLANRRNRGKWVCYWLEQRLCISRRYTDLIDAINRLNVPDREYIFDKIDERAGSEEEEEIDPPSGGF